MGIRTNIMGEHFAQCAAADYKASELARCPYSPQAAIDARGIGRYLHAQGLPLPRSVNTAGRGRYEVDGVIFEVNPTGEAQMLQ